MLPSGCASYNLSCQQRVDFKEDWPFPLLPLILLAISKVLTWGCEIYHVATMWTWKRTVLLHCCHRCYPWRITKGVCHSPGLTNLPSAIHVCCRCGCFECLELKTPHSRFVSNKNISTSYRSYFCCVWERVCVCVCVCVCLQRYTHFCHVCESTSVGRSGPCVMNVPPLVTVGSVWCRKWEAAAAAPDSAEVSI